MSAADVAAAIKIKLQYVEAIEKNQFQALIAPIYARGFIKLYARCVGLDPEPLLCQVGALEAAPRSAPEMQRKPVRPRRTMTDRVQRLAGWLARIRLPDLRLPAADFKISRLLQLKIAAIAASAIVCVALVVFAVSRAASSQAKLRPSRALTLIADPPEPFIDAGLLKISGGR